MSDFAPDTVPDAQYGGSVGGPPPPKKKSGFPFEILPVGCAFFVLLGVLGGLGACYFDAIQGEERARRYAEEDRRDILMGRSSSGDPTFWDRRAEEHEQHQVIYGVCNGCGCFTSVGFLVAAVFVRKKRTAA